jgi:hypothetical protein
LCFIGTKNTSKSKIIFKLYVCVLQQKSKLHQILDKKVTLKLIIKKNQLHKIMRNETEVCH